MHVKCIDPHNQGYSDTGEGASFSFCPEELVLYHSCFFCPLTFQGSRGFPGEKVLKFVRFNENSPQCFFFSLAGVTCSTHCLPFFFSG